MVLRLGTRLVAGVPRLGYEPNGDVVSDITEEFDNHGHNNDLRRYQ